MVNKQNTEWMSELHGFEASALRKDLTAGLDWLNMTSFFLRAMGLDCCLYYTNTRALFLRWEEFPRGQIQLQQVQLMTCYSNSSLLPSHAMLGAAVTYTGPSVSCVWDTYSQIVTSMAEKPDTTSLTAEKSEEKGVSFHRFGQDAIACTIGRTATGTTKPMTFAGNGWAAASPQLKKYGCHVPA